MISASERAQRAVSAADSITEVQHLIAQGHPFRHSHRKYGNTMTVSELIAALQNMPQNVPVLHFAFAEPGRSNFREVHDVIPSRCKWNEDDLEYLEGGPINGEQCVVLA